MRAGKRAGIGTVAAAALALAVAAFMRINGSPEPPEKHGEQSPGPMTLTLGGDNPNKPDYPDEWRVADLRKAAELAGFEVLVPDVPAANPGNLTDIIVFPTGAAVLDFPAPAKSDAYVRQNYIEVYQAPWPDDEDPLAWFEKDLPSPATSIIEIGGIPSLAVTAHSPVDIENANPAYLEFVVKGIDVQLSGGESLDLLEEIAADMIAKA